MPVVGELWVLPESEERPGYTTVEWRIPPFVFLPVKELKVYKSDSFEFSGERWHLSIFRDQLSILHIAKEASPRECSVHFEASFKRSDGTLLCTGKKTNTFKREHDDYYCYFFGNISVLPDEHETIVFSFLTDGQHRVSLLKSVVDIASNSKAVNEPLEAVEVSTQTESDNSISNPVNESSDLVEASTQTESDNCIYKLSSDLRQMLLNGEDSDLTVRVKGVEFRLHRNMMGVRTPVFSAMLRHDMQENATGIVCIDDCEPDVFQDFTRYLYSGTVNEMSTDTVFELFALANKYQVDELKSACLEFIRRSVSLDTFCDVLNVALTYEQGELLKQATDFFAHNLEDILQTVKWMNFMSDNPIQANELILKAVQINNFKMKEKM